MVINSREYDKLETARAISQIWDVLTADERTLLLQRIQINTYQKNEIIHDEGTDPQFMMCLMQGKVKVYMSGEVGRNSIIRVISLWSSSDTVPFSPTTNTIPPRRPSKTVSSPPFLW